MTRSSRLSALLSLGGAALIAVAWALTRPYSWSRFCLLVAAGLILAASPGAIRRAFADLVNKSRAQSDQALEALKRRPIRHVLYAIWLGCIAALIEIGIKSFENAAGKRVLSQQYFWEVPVGHLVPLVVIGVLAAVLARGRPQRSLRVVTFMGVFMPIVGWIMTTGQGVHVAAAAAFAAGIGAQLAKLAGRHPLVVHTLMRRTLPGLAVIVACIAGTAFMQPRWSEARALAALPPPPAEAPNVVLITLDTVRAASLSLYGYDRQTSPNLARFAQDGVVFTRAFSTSPWTLPSHGAMFTGRQPHELTAAWKTPIDNTHPMLAEVLRKSGYLTAGFAGNIKYCPAEFGLARGFTHYEDHPRSVLRSLLSTSFGETVSKALSFEERYRFWLKSAARLNTDFLRWIDHRPAGRPFFAFINYYDAHAPYLSPPEFGRRFSATPPRGDIWTRKLDEWRPDEIRELNAAYDSAIAYLDDELGKLFEALRQRDLLRNTAIIITADHGEQFGEHGLLEHANSLYLSLLHVPLVVVYPGQVPAGLKVETFVSLRDLAATVMTLSGQASATTFPGNSLTRLWTPGAPPVAGAETPFGAEVNAAYPAYPNSYPARQGPMRSLFAGTWHYIRNDGNKREELYDLAADFQEQRNLSDTPLVQEYRTMLERLLREEPGKR